jgi:hypothetical protein
MNAVHLSFTRRRFFASLADDDFKYVLKFKGAGHGVKALIAELIGG